MDFEAARAAVAAGTPAAEAAAAVVAGLTEDERLWCLDGDAPNWAGLSFMTQDDGYHKIPCQAARLDRIGFPGVQFADGPRGCVVGNATAFPVAMARGATWDPELEERIGEVIGTELRAAGANYTGAVCVNILRHPAWGRAQETYGEDPHHVGEMGAAFTRGLQRHVLACVKHFACNSMENARFSVDIEVDEVALHELYLPHFRRIVDEGVASVMTAYNSVNGEWCGQSFSLIRDVLRGEWGFDGFVISDFIFGLRDAATSLQAGLDIEMPHRQTRFRDLRAALEDGVIAWADVDAAAARTIATFLRFDDVLSAPSPPTSVLGAPEHRAFAREVAGRSAVLLRNESVDGTRVLPFDPATTVAVIGALGSTVNLGDGGSSDVWDLECRTIAQGFASTPGAVVVDDGDDLDRAAAAASSVDVAIVVVGYTAADEGEYIGATDPSLTSLFPPADDEDEVAAFEARKAAAPPVVKPEHLAGRSRGFETGGDRTDLGLAAADVALIRAVAAANARTVVVLQAGSAVVVDEWIDDVGAVVQAWYAGCQAGPGLVDVLTGAVNPSARLPFSVPRRADDLPPFDRDATSFRYDRWFGWWHLARTGAEPRFPFGFGLSYTDFAITESDVAVRHDVIEVVATVENTGGVDGADVVQVYASLPDPEAPDRLVGFARVDVPSGETAGATVRVPVDALATRDTSRHDWAAPAGEHTLRIARNATDPHARIHRIQLG